MKLTTLKRVVMFVSVAAFVIACKQPPLEPLRLGTNRWPGYEPLYLAKKLGLLEKKHFRLIEYLSATDTMYAMRDKSIDLAALTLDEALVLIQDGLDLKVVLILDFSSGGDAVIAKPDISSLSALKGKRIAYEPGAVGVIMMDALLTEAGLSADQVILVNRTVDQHVQVYDQNQADVIVTFEPVVSALSAKGGHRLFDSRSIPGRIVDVLVVHKEIFEQDKARVSQLIDVWFQALDLIRTDSHSIMPVMANRMGLTQKQLEKSYQGLVLPSKQTNREYLLSSDRLKNQAESLQQLMINRKLLLHPVNLERVFDGTAL